MSETKKLLLEEYKGLKELEKVIDPKSEKHDEVIELENKVRDQLIKYDSAELDYKSKKEDREAENNRQRKKNIIDIVFGLGTFFLSIWTVIITLDFDRENSVTSTTGKGIISQVALGGFRNIFKRK